VVEKIGIIGLGLVGTAIAECLLSNQFDVVGFDIDSARCKHLKELGACPTDEPLGRRAIALGGPAEVAQEVERVILSLPDTETVQRVIEGPGGILKAKTPPRYIIDTTTGDPDATAALAERLRKQRFYLLDATISGSSQQVRNREAVFMVGGDKAAFEICQDIFRAITEKVFYLGPSGNGSRAKLASNLVLGLNRLALAEGLVFAGKLGLEPEAFLELLKVTPAYSAIMDTKGKKMLNGDFAPQARLRQHHKDVSIILKYAEKTGQELPLSRVHFDVLERAIAAGDGDLDNSAVIREIERRKRAKKRE
jgi:3-hydroxyisobutyrate dehydrogenase-like beta-hydroxyacid dehydrogenase